MTIAKRPSAGRDGAVMDLIWAKPKGIYFCGWDWTTQIRLMRNENLAFTRNAGRYPFFHPPLCPGAPPVVRGAGPNAGPDWRESLGWKILLPPLAPLSSCDGLRAAPAARAHVFASPRRLANEPNTNRACGCEQTRELAELFLEPTFS